jgi:hypothetical protein
MCVNDNAGATDKGGRGDRVLTETTICHQRSITVAGGIENVLEAAYPN